MDRRRGNGGRWREAVDAAGVSEADLAAAMIRIRVVERPIAGSAITWCDVPPTDVPMVSGRVSDPPKGSSTGTGTGSPSGSSTGSPTGGDQAR